MVSNKFSAEDVKEKAGELDFPGSVLEFLEGLMGQPFGMKPYIAHSTSVLQCFRSQSKTNKSLIQADFQNHFGRKLYAIGGR